MQEFEKNLVFKSAMGEEMHNKFIEVKRKEDQHISKLTFEQEVALLSRRL